MFNPVGSMRNDRSPQPTDSQAAGSAANAFVSSSALSEEEFVARSVKDVIEKGEIRPWVPHPSDFHTYRKDAVKTRLKAAGEEYAGHCLRMSKQAYVNDAADKAVSSPEIQPMLASLGESTVREDATQLAKQSWNDMAKPYLTDWAASPAHTETDRQAREEWNEKAQSYTRDWAIQQYRMQPRAPQLPGATSRGAALRQALTDSSSASLRPRAKRTANSPPANPTSTKKGKERAVDVPPIKSASRDLVKFVFERENEREEAVYR